MNINNGGADKAVREQLTFFTLQNGIENNNPRSRAVILALKDLGQHAYVKKSIEEIQLMEPVAGMVALFDTDCVSRPSFVERQKEDGGIPSWASEFSTESCAGICMEAVARQHIIMEVARKLVLRFTPEYDGDYHRQHDAKERYRRTIPAQGQQRVRHITRPQGHFMPAREPRRKVSL